MSRDDADRLIEAGGIVALALNGDFVDTVTARAYGHHALALVKDVERLARMARSKPGNAKEGFAELATQLGKSVPHFLPTFFEQAGRAFVAADNKLTAAVMVGRAREAERVYALDIDEERQRDVFLEFAPRTPG